MPSAKSLSSVPQFYLLTEASRQTGISPQAPSIVILCTMPYHVRGTESFPCLMRAVNREWAANFCAGRLALIPDDEDLFEGILAHLKADIEARRKTQLKVCSRQSAIEGN